MLRPLKFILHIFSVPVTVFEILKKKLFYRKSLLGARGRKNVLNWVEIGLKYFSKLGIERTQ